MNRRTSKIMACLALFVVATVSTAFAGVTLTSSELSAVDDYAPNSQFTVRIAVTANDTGSTPSHAALRIGYDTANVTFVSAAGDPNDGWLGDVDAGAVGAEEVVSGTQVTRDIPTLGNFGNAQLLPNVMDVTFEMTASPTYPFDITVEMDPGTANPLISTTASSITVDAVDDSGTAGLTWPFASVAQWRELNY